MSKRTANYLSQARSECLRRRSRANHRQWVGDDVGCKCPGLAERDADLANMSGLRPTTPRPSPACPWQVVAPTVHRAPCQHPSHDRHGQNVPPHIRRTLRASEGFHQASRRRGTKPARRTSYGHEMHYDVRRSRADSRALECVWSPAHHHPELFDRSMPYRPASLEANGSGA